jgi:hypothetical protein
MGLTVPLYRFFKSPRNYRMKQAVQTAVQGRYKAVQGRQVEVRTNLDELVEVDQVGMKRRSYRRRASVKFVEIERHGEAFLDLPEVGDPWCDLTVRARLERAAEAYGRLPEVKLREHPRSCMPEVVRERWKDEPKEQRRPLTDRALADADLTAAHQVIDLLTREQRPIAWAIAEKMSDRKLGKALGCHNMTAARRKHAMLLELAHHWNGLGLRPDESDVKRAAAYLGKNI